MFNDGLNKNVLISYTPVLPDLSWAISLNVNSFSTSKNCRLVGGSSSSFWAEVSSPLKLYKIPSLKDNQAKRIIWQTYLSPLSESLDRVVVSTEWNNCCNADIFLVRMVFHHSYLLQFCQSGRVVTSEVRFPFTRLQLGLLVLQYSILLLLACHVLNASRDGTGNAAKQNV